MGRGTRLARAILGFAQPRANACASFSALRANASWALSAQGHCGQFAIEKYIAHGVHPKGNRVNAGKRTSHHVPFPKKSYPHPENRPHDASLLVEKKIATDVRHASAVVVSYMEAASSRRAALQLAKARRARPRRVPLHHLFRVTAPENRIPPRRHAFAPRRRGCCRKMQAMIVFMARAPVLIAAVPC